MSTQQILTGALVVQGLLAALTWWPSDPGPVASTPLVPGGGNSITEVTITGPGDDAEPLTLARDDDDRWVIATAHDYPASASKVGEILDALGALTLDEPIATTAARHDQLDVGDDTFGRKVTFTADGDTTTVYLGAARAKAVHLRVEGEDAVYLAKGASEWTFKDTPRMLWDPSLVDVSADELTSLRLARAGVSQGFVKDGEDWVLDAPAAEGLVPDMDALQPLLDGLDGLRIADVVAAEAAPEHGLDAGLLVEWTVSVEDQTLTDRLYLGTEDDGEVHARHGDDGPVVTVRASAVSDLTGADLAALVVAAPEDAGSEDAGADDAPEADGPG